MTSNKPLENETIDDLLKNKDEVYTNEVMETPDYSYWASQMPLDWSYQVRNINTWWWKIKTWYISVNSWYTNQSITWIWFKPKAIQITIHSWNKVAWWYANDNNWTIQQQCIYADNWSYIEQNWRLFRFDNTNRWLLVSFDNDWFTIKSDLSAVMIYQCYW